MKKLLKIYNSDVNANDLNNYKRCAVDLFFNRVMKI